MNVKLNSNEAKITNDSESSKVIKNTICNDWKATFDSESEELDFLSQIIKKNELINGMCFPNKQNIFRAFQLTPLAKVNAVFLSIAPYDKVDLSDGSPLANGLAFSVHENCTMHKELVALYRELASPVATFTIPTHGHFTSGPLEVSLCLTLSLTVPP